MKIDKNAISSWHAVDQLNDLSNLESLVFQVNPVSNELDTFRLNREVLGRLPGLTSFNDTQVTEAKRKTLVHKRPRMD